MKTWTASKHIEADPAVALVTSAFSEEGLSFAIPAGSLAAFAVVAIIAGVLAAVLPARRAARTNVLAALAYE